ncbi:hypothetical protein [Aquisphaera insulae]|uniref:hypothetical protein n=1 Tax=Aquisphaera insulae TaxID=2712864 RepID=UPI0013EA6612|nr:hypothetical protein [Aquisphaera insulae]
MRQPDGDELNDLEGRLRTWQPSAGGLDREAMIFEAGRASVRRSPSAAVDLRAWRLATAAAVVLAAGLAMGWIREHRHARGMEQMLLARAEAAATLPAGPAIGPPTDEPPRPFDPSSYLALAREIQDVTPVKIGVELPDVRQGNPAGATAPPEAIRVRDLDRALNL